MTDRIIVTTVGINRDRLSIHQQARLCELQRAIEHLRHMGVVVTVELVPHRPLRMGAYDTLIEVREAMDHKALAAERGGYRLCPQCGGANRSLEAHHTICANCHFDNLINDPISL